METYYIFAVEYDYTHYCLVLAFIPIGGCMQYKLKSNTLKLNYTERFIPTRLVAFIS